MTRRLLCVISAAVAVLVAGPSAVGAQSLTLGEARSGAFPERAFVVTLPEAQMLPNSQVTVRENGDPVDRLSVEPLRGRSAVVLAIDTSQSMRGKLGDAMAAAREFARRRQEDQKLGVVFFSREPQVVLEPTTDQVAIDRALGSVPVMSKGTRIYDALDAGISEITRTGVPAGTVIVLSDGDDVGSIHTLNEVVDRAKQSHVRVYGVGIESPSFDPEALQRISGNGGVYVEASTAGELSPIYRSLADRASREFLVTYRSRQPLESDVAVAVSVSGVADTVTAAYRTPDFPVPPAVPEALPTFWESSTATYLLAGLVALLLGSALWNLIRPARAPLSARIATFTGDAISAEDAAHAERAKALLEAGSSRLAAWGRWQSLELDLELAKIKWKAGTVAIATVVGTVALAAIFAVLGNPAIAALAIVGVPVGTRAVIAQLAKKVRRRFEAQLPDNLQVLASALRAGHSFVGALGVMVKDAPAPSQKEFRRVVNDEQLGIPIEESLEVVDARMRCEDLVYVGLIATLSRDTGGNTAEVLDKVVETMRERAKIRRLVRTLTAQGRLGGWIITALPICMVLFLNLFQPDYMDPMFAQPLGWAIFIFAGMMIALGAYCIRRIVDIKV